jgi:hypothetical protein
MRPVLVLKEDSDRRGDRQVSDYVCYIILLGEYVIWENIYS